MRHDTSPTIEIDGQDRFRYSDCDTLVECSRCLRLNETLFVLKTDSCVEFLVFGEMGLLKGV